MTISPKEITRESYQATAQEFACNVADLAPITSIERFITLLPPKAEIIDIGCGSGRDAKIFTNRGFGILGIDFCPNLLDIATKHAPLAKFQLMDIEAMNLPTAAFNGIWAACSLSHISKAKLPQVLQQIHDLLKGNGCFYLTVKKGFGEILERDVRYEGNYQKFWSFFDADELRHFLQEASFEILEFVTVQKKFSYQTGDAFRVFAKKITC